MYSDSLFIMRGGGKSSAKLMLGLAVAFNLLLLGFFKYANFLIANLNVFFDIGIQAINLPLPIGISFYTFQAMSYLIDLYRGRSETTEKFNQFRHICFDVSAVDCGAHREIERC